MRALLLGSYIGLICVSGADWTGFRGGERQGVSSESNFPTRWSATEGVAWKAAVPGEGWSSPVIAKGRVFLNTATEGNASRRVVCFDAKSGKLLWNTEIAKVEPGKKEGLNSYATPTPVTDGNRVYATAGDGSIVALDFSGKILWQNRDHRYYSVHGMGASPILWRDLVIVPFDNTSPGPDVKVGHTIPWDQSFVVALDKASGKQRWKAGRGMSRVGHVTPVVVEHEGKPVLVSGAGDWVIGYDPKTGERIWWASNKGEGVVPSSVAAAGMSFSTSGFGEPTIRAVRLGGKGDVTNTHIAWSLTRGVPMIPTLLYLDGLLYSVTEGGIAQAIRATTGEVVWTQRLGGKFFASPVSAGGKVYFLSQEGETVVIEAGAEFKEIARNRLDETTQASLAFSDGRIYLRTKENLYCITASPRPK